jgi:putative ABC transport system permease protein
MIRNYLKIAWRRLLKDRQFTFLNLVGLSTGLACTFLIYLWISDEFTVDKFNEKDSQLFQVMVNRLDTEGNIETEESTPALLAKALAEEIPEVEYATAVVPASWFSTKGVLSFNDAYSRADAQFIGKDYFNIFTCRFIQGSKSQFTADKYAIAISDEMALKLFGSINNCIGKILEWNQGKYSGQYHVAGIFERLPSNSSSPFDLLFNYELFLDKNPDLQNWGNSDPNAYVLIKKDVSIDQVNKKIAGFIKTIREESKNVLFLRKYSSQYLYGRYENGVPAGGRITYVRLFSIIAIFILFIACINFMNLATAKASSRIKEIGIKKVVGARKVTLVFQYLSESILMTILSMGIAILLVKFSLPLFNEVAGKQIVFSLDRKVVMAVLFITFLTGLIAGSYPAFYLSGFRPVSVLRGKLKTSLGEVWIRKGLVVFQFTISAILIAAVLVVYKQVEFIQSKNLGYNRDNIVHFAKTPQLRENGESFLVEVRRIPGVLSACSFSHNLTGNYGETSAVEWEGKRPEEGTEFGNLEVDYGLMELMGFNMAQGRMFSREYGLDNSNIILNEAAVAVMGLKEPVGKTIKLWDKDKKIIGIVKNFHFESLYEKVKPCFLQCSPNKRNVLVKIKGGAEKDALSDISKLYATYSPGIPFEYKFLDDDYQALYVSEQRVAALSKFFAGLAILISCLGLFGLAAFTAQKRQREIGIRKIVGASVSGVTIMLSKDFIKLVLLSLVIASPVAYYFMNKWLEGFAYRANVSAWLFVAIAVLIVIIAFITISFQTIKAALTNPVKSLRSE